MKQLFLQQCINPKYLGEHTPREPKHEYLVLKVINSVIPSVSETLTAEYVDAYCRDEEWKVTIS